MPSNKDEQKFTIQPAPAYPPQAGSGLQNVDNMAAHHARGPYVPHQDMLNKLDAPLSREELKKRSAQLNKE
ncbi:hypothetical protein FRC03_008729 [Tulasnella sp. 419]|nr:hypothetical protein FRC02_008834 [Tulasnella sp. 418]KAG8958858.1 hypothetical protein FRC03_008729 [Tulasnella sp. 419]